MEEFSRQCPDCKKKLIYSCKRSLLRAIDNNSVCNKCKKMPPQWLEHVKQSQMGKKRPNYKRDMNKPDILFRDCPDCGNEIGYKTEKHFKYAVKRNTACGSCTNNKVKHLQSLEQTRKMAATKAGYNSWEEYQSSIPAKKKYAREVWRVTRKQPIERLDNYNKRGKCGIDGAYQLDHIISIHEGFNNNIPPETIGHIKNLQIIPWKENLLKSK